MELQGNFSIKRKVYIIELSSIIYSLLNPDEFQVTIECTNHANELEHYLQGFGAVALCYESEMLCTMNTHIEGTMNRKYKQASVPYIEIYQSVVSR
jgi:hypothetical protein